MTRTVLIRLTCLAVLSMVAGCGGGSTPRAESPSVSATPSPQSSADTAMFFGAVNRRCAQNFPRAGIAEVVLAAPRLAASLGIPPSALVAPGFDHWFAAIRRLRPPDDQATLFRVQFVNTLDAMSKLTSRAHRQLLAASRHEPLPHTSIRAESLQPNLDLEVKDLRLYASQHGMPRCSEAARIAMRLGPTGPLPTRV